VSELDNVHDYKLQSGLWVRQYPKLVSKSGLLSHPAKIFDQNAKNLRMHGIEAITVDNFFRVPDKKISLVSYFVPEGKMLSQLPEKQVPLERLATFMAELHAKGFECHNPGPDMFMIGEQNMAVLDPTQFELRGSPPSLQKRRDAMIRLCKNLGLAGKTRDAFFATYAEQAGLGLSGMEA
jgi:hypothetical protein